MSAGNLHAQPESSEARQDQPSARATHATGAPHLATSTAPGEESTWHGLKSFTSPPIVAIAIFVLVGAALFLLSWASPFLNTLILSFLMVTLALPAYHWMQRRGMKKGVAIVLLAVAIAVVGLTIAALVYLSVQRLTMGMADHVERIEGSVESLLASVSAEGGEGVARGIGRFFIAFASAIAAVVTQFGISAILAAFLLIEAPRLGKLLNTSMRDLPFLGMTPQVMSAAVAYILVRLRLNLLTGLVFGLFLWVIGVDYALLWGIITVLLSFVPYVGLVLASIPPILLALAELGWGWALAVIVAVTAINFGIENVLAPAMTGKTLSLSPAVVFVAFLFWIWLLGPIGALIAMPLMVLLMLTFAHYDSTRWVAQLIGTPPE